MHALLLSLSLAHAAPAAPVFQSDDSVDVVDAGNDVFAAGEQVVVSERVGDNAFLAGEDVTIVAPVAGDLFAAGETVHINAVVHGDVFSAGETVELGPEGRIDGHLYAGAGRVLLRGPVAGDVHVGAGELVVDARVEGSVEAEVGELRLEDGARIGGDLTYAAPTAVPDAAGAVSGAVKWSQPKDDHQWEDHHEPSVLGAMGAWSLWTGWRVMGQLIVGAVLLMLGGRHVAAFGETLGREPSRALGLGLVGMVALPIASFIACALVVPLPLGLLGLATFAALLYLGQIVAAQAFGEALLSRVRPDLHATPLLHLLAGAIPLAILTGLPWVGALVGFLVTMLGAGAVALRLREATRK